MLKKVKSALAFIVTFGWLVFTFRAIHGIITAKEAEVVCLWFIAWGFPAVFILIMQESP